MTMTADD